MLVFGEAGVGKTSLLERFSGDHRESARIFWATCEALLTPGHLAPLFDIAEATGGELEELVASAAKPHEVAPALIRALGRRAPAVLVLEDVHYADEATLDVLRLIARRIQGARALVIASYRDDSLERAHPLRLLLGELATSSAVGRLEVKPLSTEAVMKLAEPHGVDGRDLYRNTNGNPFYVTEVLAAGTDVIPQTVREVVLAHAARLSPPASALLEAVAVAPPKVELWLLEALVGGAVDRLDECLASGMLRSTPGGVAFRHELARLAVEESLAPDRRLALHRAALAALASAKADSPDLPRLARHAEEAGDREAVLKSAPAAGALAASLGAHREAAAQYRRALRFSDGVPPQTRGNLLERRAYECYCTGQFDEALDAQHGALECWRGLGDKRQEGDSLRRLSRLLRFIGRTGQAAACAAEAVALLEQRPPGHELAMAYGNLSHLFMTADDAEEAIIWGTRAIELAEGLDDDEALIYALVSVGVVEFLADGSEGAKKLERALGLALEAGFEEQAARAFLSLVWWPLRQRDFPLAHRYLEMGLEYCDKHGFDLWRLFLVACRARLELDLARWEEATESAELALCDPRTWPVPRVFALSALGLARARRGEPDVWPPLDEALALAQPSGELQRIGPIAAARAEAAWLEGDHEAVAHATEGALELAVRRRASWPIGELACWRWRAGTLDECPPGAVEPYALQIAGEWESAVQHWTRLGCPYDAALALSDADGDDALRLALDELHGLGARPAAAIVARRLRERGARGLPRGPRPSTRENPAGLTARELEVLELVAQGLRNVEIAERLFLSPKTVDHHVSAILGKLEVSTRGEASAEAVRLGISRQHR